MTRRRFLSEVATCGTAMAFGGVWTSAQQKTESQYRRIVVIDGLSFLDERGAPRGVELAPRVLQAIRASGVSAVNVTIGT